MDPIILVDNVSKSFKYCSGRNRTIKDWIVYRKKYHENIISPILQNVSFCVYPGESFGIIGRNGAGKSTILKLLSKIYYPDEGAIHIRGKVSSLIELGAGFHSEMTGRENIRVNASINGLSPTEIDKKMEDIIDFSELGDYIDRPIKIYSSGMYMRLAFSIAINLDADVLLIDEILSVGDIYFQEKCFNKIKQLKDNGITIVIISHSPQQIIDNCNRAIWIDNTKIMSEGHPVDVCNKYIEYMHSASSTSSGSNMG